MSQYLDTYEINTTDLQKEDIERLLEVIKQLSIKKDECKLMLDEIKLEFQRLSILELKCFNKILKYENEIDKIIEILNEYDRNKR